MPDEIKFIVDDWKPFTKQKGTMIVGGAMKTIYEEDLGIEWISRKPKEVNDAKKEM